MLNQQDKCVLKMRLVTLFTSALITFLGIHLLIENLGPHQFSIYVVLTSLPNLLPFADLGLGAYVFNSIVETDDKKYSKHIMTQAISVVFLLLALSCLTILLAAIFMTITNKWVLFVPNAGHINLNITCLLIVAMMAISVPMSMGTRALQAANRTVNFIIFSSITPVVTFIGIVFGLRYGIENSPLFFIFPSLGYLVSTAIIFFYSGIWKYLRIPKIGWIINHGKRAIGLGFWSLLSSLILVYLLQAPKYILNFQKQFDQNIKYSLFLTLFIPGISLVSMINFSDTARFKKLDWSQEKISQVKSRMYLNVLLSISLTLTLLASGVIARMFDVNFPNPLSIIISGLALISWSCMTTLGNLFTNQKDLSFLVRRQIIPLILLYVIWIKYWYLSSNLIILIIIIPWSLYSLLISSYRLKILSHF
jgi:hypothetical protein